ncbi:MAG: endonuclease/exonuclease/phosphatase family protein [Patescibacteria group bacterium]
MRLISLNTWGGRGGKENFLKFFEAYKDVDIFCLQEVWSGGEHMEGKETGGVKFENIMYDLLGDIGKILHTHSAYFRPHYHEWYGLAILAKNTLKIVDEGELFVFQEKGYEPSGHLGTHARNIQWITFETKKGPFTVVNFHGLWNGNGKTDTEDRLLQSDKIVNFIKNLKTPHVLVGDFNLRPDTQSIKKIEDLGNRNLIKEFAVTSTRTSMYKKEERFADYAFISKEIELNEFKIMTEEVSDHAAMYLDFE